MRLCVFFVYIVHVIRANELYPELFVKLHELRVDYFIFIKAVVLKLQIKV